MIYFKNFKNLFILIKKNIYGDLKKDYKNLEN